MVVVVGLPELALAYGHCEQEDDEDVEEEEVDEEDDSLSFSMQEVFDLEGSSVLLELFISFFAAAEPDVEGLSKVISLQLAFNTDPLDCIETEEVVALRFELELSAEVLALFIISS